MFRARPVLVFFLVALWMNNPAAAAQSPTRSQADPGAASAALPDAATGGDLDEVSVTGQRERARQPDPHVLLYPSSNVFVHLDDGIGITLNLVREQPEVIFRRPTASRQLPEPGSKLSRVNKRLRLDLRPDRLISLGQAPVSDAAYRLAGNVDEADSLPAHIPLGRDVALLNLDYLSMHDRFATRMFVANAMHPQTRRCEREISIYQLWPEGTNQYVLLGSSQRSCERFLRSREADLLFAEGIPEEFRRLVMELHDPIASRMARRLGSEPGNVFVAWWPESPHDGYRLEPSWNRNSLLLFHGAGWQQEIHAAQKEALRVSFMQEQIQRRIRQSDQPGAFTRSAVRYLLLLASSEENHTTRLHLTRELPAWLAGCAGSIRSRPGVETGGENVASVECGLVLQFVYDAVARSGSGGQQDLFSTWRELLSASFRRKETGVSPGVFLASSREARNIATGLVDGTMDWSGFADALGKFGVHLTVHSGGPLPRFEVVSLQNFGD